MKYPLYPPSLTNDKFSSFLQTREKLQEFDGMDLYEQNLHFLHWMHYCVWFCECRLPACENCWNCHLSSFYKRKSADSCLNLGWNICAVFSVRASDFPRLPQFVAMERRKTFFQMLKWIYLIMFSFSNQIPFENERKLIFFILKVKVYSLLEQMYSWGGCG